MSCTINNIQDRLPGETLKDLFSTQARDYAQGRPHYPLPLFEYLATLTGRHDVAWDCGTGNGQAALGLAEFYQKVMATDPSPEQILQAPSCPRVGYSVATAEHSGLASGTADLITAAQCAHWFDHARFHQEVRRVAKPGAVVALWCYGNGRKTTPELEPVLRKYAKLVRPYWEPEMSHVWKHYATLPFPFEEFAGPLIFAEREWDLKELKAYLLSWSATRAYLQHHGEDPWKAIEEEVLQVWGKPETRHSARWQVHFRIGRVT